VAGVLIQMRTAILRRNTSGKRAFGGLALALLVTALAVATLWAGLIHYRYPGAGTNVLATLSFGWLLGWVTGPLLAGDDATLRMDYFKLLPVPARTWPAPCWARRSPAYPWSSARSRSPA
jgi:ABC-2 type transport system permease protein